MLPWRPAELCAVPRLFPTIPPPWFLLLQIKRGKAARPRGQYIPVGVGPGSGVCSEITQLQRHPHGVGGGQTGARCDVRPGRAACIRSRRHGHAVGAGHLALGPAMGLRKEQGVCVWLPQSLQALKVVAGGARAAVPCRSSCEL